MRITNINLSHVLSLKSLNIAVNPDSRILFVCGGNGVGKTAVAQSIKLALTGSLVRGVKYKNQLSELVTMGEKDGVASVTALDGDEEKTFRMNLRHGSYSGDVPAFTGDPASLDPEDFIALAPNERRSAIFRMTGVHVKPQDIVQDLVAAGHDMMHVQHIAPALRHGLEKASAEAKTAATEARGGWKAITGETYGTTKGEHWKATIPASDVDDTLDNLQAKANEATAAVKELAQRHAELRSAAQVHDALEGSRPQLDALDGNKKALNRKRQELKRAQAELDNLRASVDHAMASGRRCACPSCGTALVSNENGELEEWKEEKPAMSKDAADKAVKAAKLKVIGLIDDVQTLESEVSAGEQAAKMVENLPERPAPGAVREAEGAWRKAEAELAILNASLTTARDNEAAAQRADERTQQAAALHADVIAFSRLASALQELPGKYIANALSGVQELLDEASQAMGQQVTIGPDMRLRYGTIPYELASESQQWRCQAAIGYALAVIGGSGIVVLDRFDVLEPRSRGPVLKWLMEQRKAQVVMCATLKQAPKLPEPAFQIAWLDQAA